MSSTRSIFRNTKIEGFLNSLSCTMNIRTNTRRGEIFTGEKSLSTCSFTCTRTSNRSSSRILRSTLYKSLMIINPSSQKMTPRSTKSSFTQNSEIGWLKLSQLIHMGLMRIWLTCSLALRKSERGKYRINFYRYSIGLTFFCAFFIHWHRFESILKSGKLSHHYSLMPFFEISI